MAPGPYGSLARLASSVADSGPAGITGKTPATSHLRSRWTGEPIVDLTPRDRPPPPERGARPASPARPRIRRRRRPNRRTRYRPRLRDAQTGHLDVERVRRDGRRRRPAWLSEAWDRRPPRSAAPQADRRPEQLLVART